MNMTLGWGSGQESKGLSAKQESTSIGRGWGCGASSDYKRGLADFKQAAPLSDTNEPSDPSMAGLSFSADLRAELKRENFTFE